MATFVVGDIGGTNSRLQLRSVDTNNGEGKLIVERVYPSQDPSFATFDDVLVKFVNEEVKKRGATPHIAVLALAGPVLDEPNTCYFTNVPNWKSKNIEAKVLQKKLGIEHVELINDFKAIGIALPALADKEKLSLTPSLKPKHHGVIACLGPGTGLGECFLTWNPSTKVYDVWPTEGGHSDFAPHNGGDMALLENIRRTENIPRVDVECVLSGPGLRRIYRYLTTLPENANFRHPEVEAKFAAADPSHAAAVVSEAAKNGDVLAKKALDLFVWHLGSEAGNFALKTLPYAGIYVAGGIPPKNIDAITRNNAFMKAFLAKQPHDKLLRDTVPVYIVDHPHIGLFGAATRAVQIHKAATTSIRSRL